MSKVIIGEYKGYPTISIPLGMSEKASFTFGLSKAVSIVRFIDEIKQFVSMNQTLIEARDIRKLDGANGKVFKKYCEENGLSPSEVS